MNTRGCTAFAGSIARRRHGMRRRPLLLVLLSAALLLVGCGNGVEHEVAEVGEAREASSPAASLYLMDLPALETAFREEVARVTNRMEAGRATMDDYRAVVAEWGPRIAEYFDGTRMEAIPVTGLDGRPYRLSDATPARLGAATNVAGGMRLNTQVKLTLEEDVSGAVEGLDWVELRRHESRPIINVYFKAVDLDGRDIPGLKTYATERMQPSQLVQGGAIDLGLGWSSSEVASMQAIGGLVEITRTDYDAGR